MPTEFGLIRHSRTLWNEEKRIQGLQDSPLSQGGQSMAAAWSRELATLHWDRILASDLGRVQETVQLINANLQLPVHVEPLLREQDWGLWSGLTFPELYAKHGAELKEQEAAGWDFCPPGGEARTEVLARAQKALALAARKWPGGQILVVCHEGILKTLLYHLLGRKFLPDEPKILHGYQLHLLKMHRDSLELKTLNALKLTGTSP